MIGLRHGPSVGSGGWTCTINEHVGGIGEVGVGLARFRVASGTSVILSGVVDRERADGDDAGVVGGVGLGTK